MSNLPDGYVFCAGEDGHCTFDGTKDVAYGATGGYAFKTGVTGWHGIGSSSIMQTDPPLFYTFSQPSLDVAPVPLSVTYLAKSEPEEDTLMAETVERLGKLKLQF